MATIFLDVETTGLDPVRHDMWQVGLIADYGNEKTEELEETFCPYRLADAEPKALEVGGVTIDTLKAMPTANEVMPSIIYWLRSRATDKPIIAAGWNVQFDLDFLKRRVGHKLFYRWSLDVMALARWWAWMNPEFRPRRFSLGVVAEYIGIDLNDYKLHSALSDARLTRRICYWLWNEIREN